MFLFIFLWNFQYYKCALKSYQISPSKYRHCVSWRELSISRAFNDDFPYHFRYKSPIFSFRFIKRDVFQEICNFISYSERRFIIHCENEENERKIIKFTKRSAVAGTQFAFDRVEEYIVEEKNLRAIFVVWKLFRQIL